MIIIVADELSVGWRAMAEETIAFPDLGLIEQVGVLLAGLELPAGAEYRVEPALDYPGQQVAIDLAANSEESLISIVETVRDALFKQFRIATRTCSELDREIRAKQTA